MEIDLAGMGGRIKEGREKHSGTGSSGQEKFATALSKKLIEMRAGSLKSGRPKPAKRPKIDLSDETIRLWEVGSIVPSLERIRAMAALFTPLSREWDEEWIMFGRRRAEQMASERPILAYLDPEEIKLVQEYRHAGQSGRKSILSMASTLRKDDPLPAATIKNFGRRAGEP